MNSLLSNTKTFYQKVCGISSVLFNGVNDRTQDDCKIPITFGQSEG